MKSLKQNQFLSTETFEEFLEKANRKRGKRTTFKKPDADQVNTIYNYYLDTAKNVYQNKIADRFRAKEVDLRAVMQNNETNDEIREIERAMKIQKQLVFVGNVRKVHQERQAKELQDLAFKQLPGETVFPFVHGEQVEQMRATIRENMRINNEHPRSSTVLSHDGDFETQTVKSGLESLNKQHNDSQLSRTVNAKDNLIMKFCTVGSSQDRFSSTPKVFVGNNTALESAYNRFEKELLKNRL